MSEYHSIANSPCPSMSPKNITQITTIPAAASGTAKTVKMTMATRKLNSATGKIVAATEQIPTTTTIPIVTTNAVIGGQHYKQGNTEQWIQVLY